MTIRTNLGKTYTVDWADCPITNPNRLLIQMEDVRPIAQIVPEFLGLTRIDREDENQGNKTYEGYTSLTGISRKANSKVLLTLAKAAEG